MGGSRGKEILKYRQWHILEIGGDGAGELSCGHWEHRVSHRWRDPVDYQVHLYLFTEEETKTQSQEMICLRSQSQSEASESQNLGLLSFGKTSYS